MKRTPIKRKRKKNARSLAVVVMMMMMITAFGATNVPAANTNNKRCMPTTVHSVYFNACIVVEYALNFSKITARGSSIQLSVIIL